MDQARRLVKISLHTAIVAFSVAGMLFLSPIVPLWEILFEFFGMKSSLAKMWFGFLSNFIIVFLILKCFLRKVFR